MPTVSSTGNILVIDDNAENLRLMVNILTEAGYEVRAASDGDFGLETACAAVPDLILLDVKMPEVDGYVICQRLKAADSTRDIPVIFISALHEIKNRIRGFEAGGVDYINKPFYPEEILARVSTHLRLRTLQRHLEREIAEHRQAREILTHYKTHLEELVEQRTVDLQQALTEIQRLQAQLQAENVYLQEEIRQEHNFENIIGQSAVLKALLYQVEQVAPTNATVLISGETGTGKELIARAIHHASPRKQHPLVKVDCASLPVHLIESELFGREKGAFTGADTKQIGRFELAHSGTIFLDEIGELPLELQSRLLRIIQDGEFERLGNPRTIRVDVRIIAATNRDLAAEITAGRFRQDLYYRLNVYPLVVPPLRERLDDIPLLVHTFVKTFNKRLGKNIKNIPQTTLAALQAYHWPGNIRELMNTLERAIILATDRTLRVAIPKNSENAAPPHKTLHAVEREYILSVLQSTKWRIEGLRGAAIILGLPPSTLRGRMQKLDIHRPPP